MKLGSLSVIFILAGALAASAQSSAPAVISVESTAGPTAAQAVAPGALVSIYGTNLAASLTTSDSVPLSTSLGGVGVTLNSTPMPVQFVSSNQVNVQIPWSMAPTDPKSPAQLVVTSGGQASAPASVAIVSSAPTVFEFGGQAIAVNPDGSLAAAPSIIPGINTRPAKIGDSLIIFAT